MSSLPNLLRVAVAGLALGALAGCGGGGDSPGARSGNDARAAGADSTRADPAPGTPAPVAFPAPAAPAPTPDADAFYAPPADQELQTYPAGSVIRYRPITAKMAWVVPVPTTAWQILYRTNDAHGKAVATAAAVLVPDNAPATGRKLLSYMVWYDALTRHCAPSYEVVSGTSVEAAQFAPVLATGWVMVLPDYEGPNSQWMVAKMSGQGALDGIRAAENFQPAGLDGAATPTMLWGYSGGGFAAAWAAELQPSYAPELNLIGASVGGAPASVRATAKQLDGGPLTGIAYAAALGLDRAFSGEMKIEPQLNAKGRKMMSDLGAMCLGQDLGLNQDPVLAPYWFTHMNDYTTTPNVLDQPQVTAVLDQQQLGSNKPGAPLYYYVATSDEITPIEVSDATVQNYCALGAQVQYDRVPGDHLSTIALKAPAALAYLADRAAGKPVPSTCR